MRFLSRLAHKIVAIPWIYDRIQDFFGFQTILKRISPHLNNIDHQVVLDLGAGTGNWKPLVGKSAHYIWLDNDPQKLQGFRKKYPSVPATLCDATRLCLKDKSVDYAFCFALLHHLDDTHLQNLFMELSRVVRKEIFVLDPLKRADSKISNLLWKYDRGSFPRTSEELLSKLKKNFEVQVSENFSIYHHYLFCTAKPIAKLDSKSVKAKVLVENE